MPSRPPAIVFTAPEGDSARQLPPWMTRWLEALETETIAVDSLEELRRRTLRGRPRVVLFDCRGEREEILAACRWMKRDSYAGIIPCVALLPAAAGAAEVAHALQAGADEALTGELAVEELDARLHALLRRSDRDTAVHPSTRLPGTFGIEAEIARRIEAGERFGVCYADLDHFKEFNDRYGYYEGDRIIRMLAMILHDVVKGTCGDDGFVGHIGGDDFIFIVPLARVPEACEEIISVFDGLIPIQYSEQDRRFGYFFGKDRRGRLHRVPLMTLSIGVATNAFRIFTDASEVSELATEMKTYAKSLPGSVFSIDRRGSVADEDEEGHGGAEGAAHYVDARGRA